MALLHEEITKQIIGAFYAVYNELGYGFVESVYKRALAVELQARGIAFEREVMFTVYYLGVDVGDYRADLVVEGKVIVEVKTAERLAPVHEVQVVNYLRASNIPVGLLLNYGPQPVFRRLVLAPDRQGDSPHRVDRHRSVVPLDPCKSGSPSV